MLEKLTYTPLNASIQCATCKNMIPFTLTCKAFPIRIPKEILLGEWDHRESYNGDNGILYDPKDPKNPQAAPHAKNRVE